MPNRLLMPIGLLMTSCLSYGADTIQLKTSDLDFENPSLFKSAKSQNAETPDGFGSCLSISSKHYRQRCSA